MESEIKEFWKAHEEIKFDVGKEKARALYDLLTNERKIIEVALTKEGIMTAIIQKRCC